MRSHIRQRQRPDPRQRLLGRRAEGQIVGLEVAERLSAALDPTEKQQRRAIASEGIRLLVHERIGRVRLAVRAFERRGAVVHGLVAAQGRVVVHARRNDSFTTLPTMNAMFAGRSDRKSTRLNSSHQIISYAVFCLKKKICRITYGSPRIFAGHNYPRRSSAVVNGTTPICTS